MRITARLAACLAALLTLANCSTASENAEVSRAGPSAAELSPDRAPGSARDLACLAEAIYFEAGPAPEGRVAVAHVVVNRAENPKFPDTICGVVADGCQFSYRCDGRSDALAEPERRARAYRAATRVLEGASDITRGALFFHSANVAPGWFDSRPRIGAFGGNVFYR